MYCLQYRVVWQDGKGIWSNIYSHADINMLTGSLLESHKYKHKQDRLHNHYIEKHEYRIIKYKVVEWYI